MKESAHDTAFVAAVAGDATHYFGGDPRRVYLVGYSNGGKLSYSEVCEHPGLFAAMATYGAVPLADCPAQRPISTLIAAGTQDPVVRAEHSAPTSAAAVQAAVTQRRAAAHCTNQDTSHTGPLALTTWTGCAEGIEVVQAIYAGLTHYWPVAAPTRAPYTTPVGTQAAAATIMWSFLSRHSLA